MSRIMSLTEEKKDALKRANEFVIYRAWVESMDIGRQFIYKTVSGYGLSIEEAQENAQKRFRKLIGTRAKGKGFYGGGYEIIHGKEWH